MYSRVRGHLYVTDPNKVVCGQMKAEQDVQTEYNKVVQRLRTDPSESREA